MGQLNKKRKLKRQKSTLAESSQIQYQCIDANSVITTSNHHQADENVTVQPPRHPSLICRTYGVNKEGI